ncbi:MAG: DUF3788 domain-containing protein [Eubacteriales bacterium]
MIKSSWAQTYPIDQKPDWEQIESFVSSPYWSEFTGWIGDSYHVTPVIEYSKEQQGWNIKYKKGSKALCTVYPDEGRFTVLVVVPPRMEPQAESLLHSLNKKTREIFGRAQPMAIGRWLMLPVESPDSLEDVMKLIVLRVPPIT